MFVSITGRLLVPFACDSKCLNASTAGTHCDRFHNKCVESLCEY